MNRVIRFLFTFFCGMVGYSVLLEHNKREREEQKRKDEKQRLELMRRDITLEAVTDALDNHEPTVVSNNDGPLFVIVPPDIFDEMMTVWDYHCNDDVNDAKSDEIVEDESELPKIPTDVCLTQKGTNNTVIVTVLAPENWSRIKIQENWRDLEMEVEPDFPLDDYYCERASYC